MKVKLPQGRRWDNVLKFKVRSVRGYVERRVCTGCPCWVHSATVGCPEKKRQARSGLVLQFPPPPVLKMILCSEALFQANCLK